MKIKLRHTSFSKALIYTSKAINTKPNIPILANVLLETTKDSIRLAATNLDMGINIWLPGTTEVTGKTTVNGKYISDFVSAINSENVELSLEDNNLIVKTSRSNASFAVMSAAEFPVLPKLIGEPIFKIDRKEFIESMDKVLFSCSTDLSAGRIQQSGVLFDISSENVDKISFIGLDGFRLSKRESKVTDLSKNITKEEVIVPARYLSELSKILSDYSDVDELEVFLSESGSQIIFKFDDIEFSIRLLEGPYPDYRRIMPDSSSFTFEVKKSDFEDAIKVVNSFAKGNLGNRTLFDFDIENSKVTLTSTVAEVGEGKTEFLISSADGESDLNTAFTLRYLGDLVNHIKGQDIVFESKGPLAASVYKDKSDPHFVHLIMPMRRDT
ncbi:MAG: DNA polymerase III subunit beta [Candidatus Dojkabacteria bacterium]|nr:DNA polymerase III subunit beta [Candidatus Dojkabacteria bacterium]MDQ7020600.1 DNA polymerase III subunit beta [Candidatus Dojkabacteria bacterium]